MTGNRTVSSTVIVGLGQIGMIYDLEYRQGREQRKDLVCQTHATAIADSECLALVGAVDPNKKRRLSFQHHFGVPAYSDIRKVSKDQVDIVVVATPAQTHLDVIRESLVRWEPKLVICEKPLGGDISEARQIQREVQSAGSQLLVNYFRQFLPENLRIRSLIISGSWGRFLGGSLTYNHGLLRNASHFLRLLDGWLGPLRPSTPDGWAGMSSALNANFERGSVAITEIHDSPLRLAEMLLAFEGGLLRYSRGGRQILWCPREEGSGVSFHSEDCIPLHGNFSEYQRHVYDSICVHGLEADRSSEIEAALRVQEWIGEVISARV
jgi:hypothetical protein